MTTASLDNQGNVATRLLRAVLLKAGLEIGFVCVIATLAAFDNASPLLRGALDNVNQFRAEGWAYDPLTPQASLDVQLFIDDKFVATQRAGQPRPDLVTAGAATNAAHGFQFELTAIPLSVGKHSAQVYAVREAAGKNKSLIPLNREPFIFEILPPKSAM